MKSGYILLEILISVAIASVVSSGLIMAFYQINRTNEKVNDIIVINTRINIMNYQFERDISGVCVPIMEMVASSTPQDNKNQSNEKSDEHATDDTQQADQNKTQSTRHDDQENQRIQKSFYGVSKGENIELFTFITNNPLLTYWGPQAGSPIIHLVRVTYTVEPDGQTKNSYTLYRHESSELTYKNDQRSESKKIVGKHALLHGIKKITATYKYALPEKNDETDKKNKEEKNAHNAEKKQSNTVGAESRSEKKKKPVIQYELVAEWKDEPKEEIEKNKQQQKRPDVPDFVLLHIELWDLTFMHTTTFDFVYQIIVHPVSLHENNKNYEI